MAFRGAAGHGYGRLCALNRRHRRRSLSLCPRRCSPNIGCLGEGRVASLGLICGLSQCGCRIDRVDVFRRWWVASDRNRTISSTQTSLPGHSCRARCAGNRRLALDIQTVVHPGCHGVGPARSPAGRLRSAGPPGQSPLSIQHRGWEGPSQARLRSRHEGHQRDFPCGEDGGRRASLRGALRPARPNSPRPGKPAKRPRQIDGWPDPHRLQQGYGHWSGNRGRGRSGRGQDSYAVDEPLQAGVAPSDPFMFLSSGRARAAAG